MTTMMLGILHTLPGPQSVEHQALHLPRVRGCFGCDHGKALHHYKRRSKGAVLGLVGPDVTLRPFGALVHMNWLEMKNGSKAHRIAARALLITDQETEFLGVLPSKRKLASEVIRALHDFDDPGSLAIRRLISDRALEFLSAGRTLRSSRPFAHFVTVPYRHASKAERINRTAPQKKTTTTCSSTRTVPICERIWFDIEPGDEFDQAYPVAKRRNTLLRHGELPREEDGAIEFWRLKDDLQNKFQYSQYHSRQNDYRNAWCRFNGFSN